MGKISHKWRRLWGIRPGELVKTKRPQSGPSGRGRIKRLRRLRGGSENRR